MRVTVPIALMVVVAYSIVFVGGAAASGYTYDELFSSTRSTLLAGVLPLTAGALLLIGFVRWSRWDQIFSDQPRLSRRRAWWFLPALMVVVIVASLLGTEWSAFTSAHVLAMLLAAALVGFAEETLFRGILLRSLREGERSEASAMGWTTVAFGLFHLTNLALAEWGAPLQVVFAALAGVGLYLARRQTGVLVAAMALHATWDFATFVHGPEPADNVADSVANGFLPIVYLAAAVTFLAILARERHHRRDASRVPGGDPPG